MERSSAEALPAPPEVRHAVRDFVDRLRSAAGPSVEQVMIYGSVVRGEYGPDSDVDVLVHWRGPDDEARDLLARLSNEILAKHRVLVTAMPMSLEHRARVEAMGTRFWRAVQEEGVLVQ